MRLPLSFLILLTAGNAFCQTNFSTETILYRFCTQANCQDGYEPMGGLIADASGNFYGTTTLGGSHPVACEIGHSFGCGVVFKLDKGGNYSVLHNFCSETNCADGLTAQAGLTIDASGNLYGTTLYGGAHSGPSNVKGGTVFKVDSAGNYSLLYSFCSQTNCKDGWKPYTGVIVDASGNIYGTTVGGGTYDYGTVFKLDSAGNYSVLYSFCSQANCADGWAPEAGLILDASGNLYGTTALGGAGNYGTLFKLDSAGNYSVLYSFCSLAKCADGGNPLTSLIKDASGNIYGTASYGGSGYGHGTVFKLDSGGNYSVLHSFCVLGNCADGASPRSLIEDASGNFYGTTDYGTVFKLDSAGNYYTAYHFCSQVINNVCTDGDILLIVPPIPMGNLTVDSSGNIYGAANGGGINNVAGVIFKLSPPIIPAQDFKVSTLPTLVIPSPGQQFSIPITITPIGGYSQAVTFNGASCSGLPAGASCTFNPTSVTPYGGYPIDTALTVNTTSKSSAMNHLPFIHKKNVLFALLLPGLFAILSVGRRKSRAVRKFGGLVLLLFSFLSLGLWGCGGGTAGGGGGGGTGGGTPRGSYTVTVTATAPSTTRTTTFTLVVN